MIAPKTILVAVDFSESSLMALQSARELAGGFKASLHVLHVVNEPFHEAWVYFTPGAELADLLKSCETNARRRLQGLLSENASGTPTVIALGWGSACDEILNYANDHAVDLIVCGTHGRRGWNRFVLGSVAERVVRLAKCPVLTVPGPIHEAEAVA